MRTNVREQKMHRRSENRELESWLETFETKKDTLEVALGKQKIKDNEKEKADKLQLSRERIWKKLEGELKIEQVNSKWENNLRKK